MIDSVRYSRGQTVQLHSTYEEAQELVTTNTISEEPQGFGNTLCTNDGVLLRNAGDEYKKDVNTSGALSLVEYIVPKRRLYLEWTPKEDILIADDGQDTSDWALVDTISKRTRTMSEHKAFNTKPNEDLNSSTCSSGGSVLQKPRTMRILLDHIATIEVTQRGHTLSFIRKSDKNVHGEFFFQHGNADIFVRSLRHLHLIHNEPLRRGGRDEYIILTTETQKLKKTFAELDIGEIKSSRLGNESWLSNRVVGFLTNIPEYMPRASSNARSDASLIHGDRQKSPDNYQVIGLSDSCSPDNQSQGGTADKSPEDSELENVKEQDVKIVNNLPERQKVQRGDPLNEMQWREFKTPDGRISDSARVNEIIFRGGIVHSLRAEVWKYLLNYYKWSDTEMERVERRKEKSMEYYNMKAQWLAMTRTQESNFTGYRERKCQIDKDVKRTDRTQEFFAGENNPNLMLLHGILMTYAMYNFDLGYVQGMSDLLAPILEIQVNEVDAFWCFVGFMDMVLANFDMDQAGMKTQFSQLQRLLEYANPRLFYHLKTHESENMYFCFRWLLVWYKREFSNDDILKLWECFWTRLPSANFHLVFSVAILDQETDIIIENKYEFTEILKHVNELSGNINVTHTLELAEAIYLQLKSVDTLPNDIRQIIGEPVLPISFNESSHSTSPGDDDNASTDFNDDDDFDDIIRELTPEEKRIQRELLEEACERSMFLHLL